MIESSKWGGVIMRINTCPSLYALELKTNIKNKIIVIQEIKNHNLSPENNISSICLNECLDVF